MVEAKEEIALQMSCKKPEMENRPLMNLGDKMMETNEDDLCESSSDSEFDPVK